MTSIRAHCSIHAPVERVFEVFSDLEQVSARVQDIVSLEVLSEGPMAVGTRWRETRKMFGKESTEEMWVTRFEPTNGYTVEAESHGSHYISTYVFASEGSETKVTLTFEGQALNFVAKLMSFIMGPMMKKTVKQCLEKDMTELKAYIEGQKAA